MTPEQRADLLVRQALDERHHAGMYGLLIGSFTAAIKAAENEMLETAREALMKRYWDAWACVEEQAALETAMESIRQLKHGEGG